MGRIEYNCSVLLLAGGRGARMGGRDKGLLPRTLLPALDSAWKRGERSLLRALLAADAQVLDCAADDPRLANFNTPQHLDVQLPAAVS